MVNCPVVGCHFTCRKARGMSNHTVAKHPPATPYQFVCTVVAVPACNMSFPTKANLAQHVRRIHPAPGVEPKAFLCPIIQCGTRSDSLADQKKHLRGPHGLFPCPVPKCDKVLFRTALEMQHHQQTVHGSVALPALLAPPAPVAPVAQMATPALAPSAPIAPAAQMTTPVAPVAQMTTPVAPVAQMTTPAPALPAHAAPVAQWTTPVAPVAQMTTPAVSSASLAPSILVTTPISFTCPWPGCEYRTRSEPAMKEHLETTHGGKSYPTDAKDDSHDDSHNEPADQEPDNGGRSSNDSSSKMNNLNGAAVIPKGSGNMKDTPKSTSKHSHTLEASEKTPKTNQKAHNHKESATQAGGVGEVEVVKPTRKRKASGTTTKTLARAPEVKRKYNWRTPNKNKAKLYASKGITPDGQGSGSVEGDEDMAKLYASKGITPDGRGSGSVEGDEDMADA